MNTAQIATVEDLAAMERRLTAKITKALAKPASKWVSRKEAAQIMGCSIDTVDKWRSENPREWKRAGGTVLIRRAAVE